MTTQQQPGTLMRQMEQLANAAISAAGGKRRLFSSPDVAVEGTIAWAVGVAENIVCSHGGRPMTAEDMVRIERVVGVLQNAK